MTNKAVAKRKEFRRRNRERKFVNYGGFFPERYDPFLTPPYKIILYALDRFYPSATVRNGGVRPQNHFITLAPST